MHSDFRGKPENDIKDTYWTSSEGVGGNEVPTRGRLSPKKIIFTQCAKNTKLIWNSHPEGD